MNEHNINLLTNLLSKYQANQTNQILILTRLPVFFFPAITIVIAVSVYMPDILPTILQISIYLSFMLLVQYIILMVERLKIERRIMQVESGIDKKISLVDSSPVLVGIVSGFFIVLIMLSVYAVFNLGTEVKKGRFEKDTNVPNQLNSEGNEIATPSEKVVDKESE